MMDENFIAIRQLCNHYELEVSFFEALHEEGLITLTYKKNSYYLPPEFILQVEKMIRIHKELNINIEGIDVVFNLLQKMESLQNEMIQIRNKLSLYEGEN